MNEEFRNIMEMHTRAELENMPNISSSKLKILNRIQLPYEFHHMDNRLKTTSFCLGGYDYIIAENTHKDGFQMGSSVWLMSGNKTVKGLSSYALANTDHMITAIAYAPMSTAFLGGIALATKDTVNSTWEVIILTCPDGALKTHYVVAVGNVNAMCTYGSHYVANTRLFMASDKDKKIYNMKYADGTDVKSFNYPTGITTINGMCIDSFGLLYVSCNTNTIYVLDLTTGAIIEQFDIPILATGSIDMRDGKLYVFDHSSNMIFELSLGGLGAFYNGNIVNHIPMSSVFEHKGAVSVAGEPNILYENGKFRLWYSAGGIFYKESADGITFGNSTMVIPRAGRSHVFKEGNTYHCFYVGESGWNTIYHATSSDGVTWSIGVSVITISAIIAACPSWVITDIGNICVVIENGTWRMLIEAKKDDFWSLGYAESTDGTTWTIDVNSPTTVNRKLESEGTFPYATKSISRPRLLFKDTTGRYWFTGHEAVYQTLPTKIGLYWSDDFKHLYPIPSNPLIELNGVDEVDQVADASAVYVNGNIYLYHSAVRNYGVNHANLKLELLKMSPQQLIEIASVIPIGE